METRMIYIITGCNVFMSMFWVAGELLNFCANKSLADDDATGKNWQRQIDAYEQRQGEVLEQFCAAACGL